MSEVVRVVRTYLELRSLEQLRPVVSGDPNIQFLLRDSIAVDHYRRLYQSVGDRWHWHDRNAWPDDKLAAHLASSGISVWECLSAGTTAGFFELARHTDDSVEIAYFGLVEEFMGRGLGKAMLTRAAQQAWALGPERVWLHTCTLDSPRALPNYLARGFEKTRIEIHAVELSTSGPASA